MNRCFVMLFAGLAAAIGPSAFADEPTKLTAWISGWVRMASTATLSPWTTLSTPAGAPASIIKVATQNFKHASGFKI